MSRQLQILQMRADGWINKQIAEELKITEHGVKMQLHRLYEKLGADNSTHAVALAMRRKLIV
jgi:two-component system NarL family response regulator